MCFLTNERSMLSRHPSNKERQPGRCRQTGLLFKYDLPASCSGVAEVQWTYRTIYCLCVSGPRFGALSLGHEDVVDGFQISLTLGWRSRISLETQRAVGQQHPILAPPPPPAKLYLLAYEVYCLVKWKKILTRLFFFFWSILGEDFLLKHQLNKTLKVKHNS